MSSERRKRTCSFSSEREYYIFYEKIFSIRTLKIFFEKEVKLMKNFKFPMYIIYDIMTWSRAFLFSSLMLIYAFTNAPFWVALPTFIIGVLSDMESYFVNKYPYPPRADGTERWWRKQAFIARFETVADIIFGICSLIFVTFRISHFWGRFFLAYAIILALYVELLLLLDRIINKTASLPSFLKKLVLIRRNLYFGLIGTVILMITYMAVSKILTIFWIFIAIYLILGAIIWRTIATRKRVTEAEKH